MNLVITGANGYIGRHVVASCLQHNISVIAIDRDNQYLPPQVPFHKIDIFDAVAWQNFLHTTPITHFLHLAWQDGFNHKSLRHIENIDKHFKLLCQVEQAGCTSITVMGSVHEVGYYEGCVTENTPCNPLSYYGIAKNTLRQLLFVHTQSLPVSVKWLRAYYITGDDQQNNSVFTKILQAAKEGKKEFPFTSGTNQFDFIDISRLANQVLAASTQKRITGIINVCSGQPVPIKDKVEEFIREHHLDIHLQLNQFPQRAYDSAVIYGDTSKIQQILKYAHEDF